MSFDSLEKSQAAGNPVEFFKFVSGARSFWYTSADDEITYLGDLYTPETIVRGSLSQDDEEESGHIEITIPRTNPIAALYVPYTPEPAMALTLYQKHRSDPQVIAMAFTVASGRFQGSTCVLTCLPIFEVFRHSYPRNTCQAQCNWALYSAQCGVGRATFLVVGVVTTITGDTIQATAFGTKPDGWFNNGYVERANGERRWVVGHVGATLTLMSPFLDLTVNESVTAYAGCDRTEAVCKSKFNNVLNHLGFARVPNKNPFQTGVT